MIDHEKIVLARVLERGSAGVGHAGWVIRALVEAVEAAKDVLDDPGAAGPWSDLDAALDRFDWTSRNA